MDRAARAGVGIALTSLVAGFLVLVGASLGWRFTRPQLIAVAVVLVVVLVAGIFLTFHALFEPWLPWHRRRLHGVGRRLEAKPKPVGDREWGYGRAIDGRLVAAFVSVTVTVWEIAIDEGLIALTCDLYRKGRPILSLPLSDPGWLRQAKGPKISQDVIFHRTFEQSDYGSAPRATTGDELEPRISAQFSSDQSIDSVSLPIIPVRGPYQP